jgi:hypothetical protein
MQTRQNAQANTIGALTARLQFLLAEAARLEQQIQVLKAVISMTITILLPIAKIILTAI